MEEQTITQKWEGLGILESTPEDRKDKVANALDVALKAMLENHVNSDDTQYETLPFPIIVRIVNVVDVPDEDIPRLCFEARSECKKFCAPENLSKLGYEPNWGNIEFDLEFAYMFAETKIEYYKNKNNLI